MGFSGFFCKKVSGTAGFSPVRFRLECVQPDPVALKSKVGLSIPFI